MGVQGLLTYIAKNPAARTRIKLGELSQKVRERTGKKTELLCDYYSVIHWILKSYDCAQIQRGKLPPYSIMYGGDLRLYGSRVISFVKALESLDVAPVFFIDGPPGTNQTDFKAKFSELKQRHHERLDQCAIIQQVCGGNHDLLKVKWKLKEGVSTQIQFALKSAGVHLIYCLGEADGELLEYLQSHEEACGILSTDTDFAVADDSVLFHTQFFDLEDSVGISSECIHEAPSDITCEVITPKTLTDALCISQSQAVDLAVLCGNDFTRELNTTLSPWATLGLNDSRVETVAKWLQDQTIPLLENPEMAVIYEKDQRYQVAVEYSVNAYTAQGGRKNSSFECASLLGGWIQKQVRKGIMTNHLLAIANSIYWRFVVVEPVSLGQPCINDLTLHLRKTLYIMMGLKEVREYGRTTSKSFTETLVHVDCPGIDDIRLLFSMSHSTVNERLATLFYLMINIKELRQPSDIRAILARSFHKVVQFEEKVSSKAVLVCACLLFMHIGNTRVHPSPRIKVGELDALLVTCLACVAHIPPCHNPHLPPARALTVGMWFTHLLEQAYILASYLCLSEELPPPAEVFYSLAYVPFHMVAFIDDDYEDVPLLNSPYLHEAYRIFGGILNCPSVLGLRAEILNKWNHADFSRLLCLFASSLESVQSRKDSLTPREGLTAVPTPELEVSFEGEHDADSIISDSAIEMPPDFDLETSQLGKDPSETKLFISDSDTSFPIEYEELSSTQEYVASEEYLYISSQSQPTAGFADEGPPPLEVMPPARPGLAPATGEKFYQPSPGSAVLGDAQELAAGIKTSTEDYSYPSSEACEDLDLPDEFFVRPEACRDGFKLPVMEHRGKILELINSHRVVCIEGETGCGKSTKVPQFILDDAQTSNPPNECRILVTQPRRVAAMKLAERVATERGERVGMTVGYCIGGERHWSPDTALTYCTTGYLLQVSKF